MNKFTENDWKLYYQIWPLFDWLRDEEYFKEEYKKIFNEDFVYKEINSEITLEEIKKVRQGLVN